MKFRTKPVVIQARHFAATLLERQEAIATWCGGKLCGIRLEPEDRVIRIPTEEGELEAVLGDWIIRGVGGEFFPCKPALFALTYEAAE